MTFSLWLRNFQKKNTKYNTIPHHHVFCSLEDHEKDIFKWTRVIILLLKMNCSKIITFSILSQHKTVLKLFYRLVLSNKIPFQYNVEKNNTIERGIWTQGSRFVSEMYVSFTKYFCKISKFYLKKQRCLKTFIHWIKWGIESNTNKVSVHRSFTSLLSSFC